MIELISFDCYGTLIDWETGILDSLVPILKKHGIEISNSEILKLYADFESNLERSYKPYKEILREVVDMFGKRFGFTPSQSERNALMDSIVDWKPFEDAPGVLSKLKERYKLAIISNIDNDIIAETVKSLGVDFDHIVTAQMARAYKPSLEIFKLAHELFGIDKEKWLHVAQSVYHDIIPAKKLGLKVVLVRRRGYGATPVVHEKADYEIDDLNGIFNISPLDL